MIPIRDENPTRRFPVVTIALITANCAAFLYQLSLGPDLRTRLAFTRGLVPFLVRSLPEMDPGAVVPVTSTFLTSMFLHGDLFHLLGNMLFMWVFADNIEDRMGRFRFLIFYLLCGLCAAGVQVAVDPESRIPMIGASGAISGVMGAYMLLFPRVRIMTVIPIFIFLQFVRLPAVVVLGLWFLFQILYSAMSDPAQGGVAWFAHIGGFVAGIVLLFVFLPRRPPPVRLPERMDWV
jgi:membrane associated rhomboid family serine protease